MLSTNPGDVSTAATGGSEERSEPRESRARGLPGACGAGKQSPASPKKERARGLSFDSIDLTDVRSEALSLHRPRLPLARTHTDP